MTITSNNSQNICSHGFQFFFILQTEAFTDLELLKIVKDVACGMEYVHSKDYLHRDLACRNIMINSHKQGKIGDFEYCIHVGYTNGQFTDEVSTFSVGIKILLPIKSSFLVKLEKELPGCLVMCHSINSNKNVCCTFSCYLSNNYT